jgi:hypothetical protein
MRGALYGHHYARGSLHWQCWGIGVKGKYIIRQYRPKEWWAIQLFGAIGCIAGEGESAEEAFGKAEEHYKRR